MTRVGLYGGSFDPIHNGHLEPVRRALEQLALDRVIYLPTAHPPHKREHQFASALRRYAMTELALLGDSRLVVSDFEIASGPSYTIDTVEHFAAEMPQATLHLLVGSDSLAQIESWRRWRDLLNSVRLGVLRRPGWSRDEALAALAPETRTRLDARPVTFIDNPPLDISATEIRRRLASGAQLGADWLPPAVLEYVTKYDLYS